MDRNWHIEVERRRIKLVVLRRGRALAARKGMQADGFEALFFAALHFGNVFLCTDIWHNGNADQAIEIDRAILLDKVIVERADNCQKSFLILDLRVTRLACEQQLAIDPIDLLFSDSLLGKARAHGAFKVQMDGIKLFRRLSREQVRTAIFERLPLLDYGVVTVGELNPPGRPIAKLWRNSMGPRFRQRFKVAIG